MKTSLKSIFLLRSKYINLSKHLRKELEFKMDNCFIENRLIHYMNAHPTPLENVTKIDFLCVHLVRKTPKDYVLSGELLQGIKTWFNMYYDDRLSVIDKFKTCYHKAVLPKKSK